MIPYNSTAVTVKNIAELNVQEPTLNYAKIGWNVSNYKKLPVKYWTSEDYIDEKQDDWLKSHPNLDEIKLLVTADIDQDTFYNNFAGKVRNIIEKEIQPNIDIYIKQLPDGKLAEKKLKKTLTLSWKIVYNPHGKMMQSKSAVCFLSITEKHVF